MRTIATAVRESSASQWIHFKAAAALVFILGAFKVIGLFKSAPVELAALDPLLRVPMGYVSGTMAGVECILAVFMLRARSFAGPAYCCTGLGFGFIAYRWLKIALGLGAEPCGCLGIARSWLGVLRYFEENLLIAIAVWLLVIGLWSLWVTTKRV